MTEAPARFAGFRPAASTFLGELCVSDYDAGAGPPTVTSTRRSWPGVGSLLLSPCPLTTRALCGNPVTLQLGGYGIGPSQGEALIITGGARRIGIPGDLNG
jgi:hypothetical protein